MYQCVLLPIDKILSKGCLNLDFAIFRSGGGVYSTQNVQICTLKNGTWIRQPFHMIGFQNLP